MGVAELAVVAIFAGILWFSALCLIAGWDQPWAGRSLTPKVYQYTD
ncbi:hypothetical protein MCP1_70029 [Candidatus Terasakiella magnetica]|nr:hypothetical protein MCP1_70029 [Candidatus Terasakiella magnetica]